MRAPMPSTRKKMCSEEESELRRGPWTLEEDTLLTHYISRHGEGRWNMLAKCAGLKRTGKSCRLRWLNYLKPDIRRGNLTAQEQLLILELHSKWGNRWSKIAQHLPGRTDNEIKNYWRTRVQKQARQLKIESNSKRFLDAVRCFWMPRLAQKVEQTSSYSSASTSSSSSAIFSSQNHHAFSASLPTSSTISPFSAVCSAHSTVASYSYLGSENSSFINSPGAFSANSSMTMSEQPEIPENTRSPLPPVLVGADTFSSNPVLPTDNYNMEVGDCGYYMDGFNMASVPELGNFGSSSLESQMAEGSWVSDDFSDSLWNMDDIWQLRELGGRVV